MPAVYDEIGHSYIVTRQPDPRIAQAIWAALGEARTVLNVGAATGSYEPAGLQVMAVEPSRAMIQQRLIYALGNGTPSSAGCVSRQVSISATGSSLRRSNAVLQSLRPMWSAGVQPGYVAPAALGSQGRGWNRR
jgi:hypothetical protein